MIDAPDPKRQPHPSAPEVPSPDPRRFLEHFAVHRRAGVANLFHYAVRGGADTPAAILAAIRATLHRRLAHPDPLSLAHFEHVLTVLAHDEPGALAYAAHVCGYEALPPAQRQQVKAERALHYVTETMRTRDVTEPQLAYLRALRYEGPTPANRHAASVLIDRLLRERRRA